MKKYCRVEWKDFINGLKARLYRTQFGFLTEYHAFLLSRLVFGEKSVKKSKELDRNGVDFQISYSTQTYNIHIFVDTKRAWEFRKYKSKTKFVDKLKGIHVNLPYSLMRDNFNSLKYLENGFGIFKVGYLEYLKKEMDKNILIDKEIIGTSAQGFVYNVNIDAK